MKNRGTGGRCCCDGGGGRPDQPCDTGGCGITIPFTGAGGPIAGNWPANNLVAQFPGPNSCVNEQALWLTENWWLSNGRGYQDTGLVTGTAGTFQTVTDNSSALTGAAFWQRMKISSWQYLSTNGTFIQTVCNWDNDNYSEFGIAAGFWAIKVWPNFYLGNGSITEDGSLPINPVTIYRGGFNSLGGRVPSVLRVEGGGSSTDAEIEIEPPVILRLEREIISRPNLSRICSAWSIGDDVCTIDGNTIDPTTTGTASCCEAVGVEYRYYANGILFYTGTVIETMLERVCYSSHSIAFRWVPNQNAQPLNLRSDLFSSVSGTTIGTL